MSNHHLSTASDGNSGKLLPSGAPPLLSPFWSFLVLFGSPPMNWVGWPTGTEKKQKTSVMLFGLGGGSTKPPMCGK